MDIDTTAISFPLSANFPSRGRRRSTGIAIKVGFGVSAVSALNYIQFFVTANVSCGFGLPADQLIRWIN